MNYFEAEIKLRKLTNTLKKLCTDLGVNEIKPVICATESKWLSGSSIIYDKVEFWNMEQTILVYKSNRYDIRSYNCLTHPKKEHFQKVCDVVNHHMDILEQKSGISQYWEE